MAHTHTHARRTRAHAHTHIDSHTHAYTNTHLKRTEAPLDHMRNVPEGRPADMKREMR